MTLFPKMPQDARFGTPAVANVGACPKNALYPLAKLTETTIQTKSNPAFEALP
jgi:hypothetical protein